MKRKNIINLLQIAFILIVINVISNSYFTRIDFTKEKRYTLSNSTTFLLKQLESELVVNVFLDGELPSNFKRLRKSTIEILEEFNANSNGKVRFNVIDPLEDANIAVQNKTLDSLMQLGLLPTNLMMKTEKGNVQKIIVPGALMFYNGNSIAVNLLQNRSNISSATQEETVNSAVENLEYQLTSSIKKLVQTQKPFIGFTIGHQEASDESLLDLAQTLSSSFNLRRVDLNQISSTDLNKFTSLVIAQPKTAFTENEKYKLDQYIVNGGNLMLFIDPVDVQMDSIRTQGMTVSIPRNLNLDDFLFKLGIRLEQNTIQDIYCGQIPIMVGTEGQAQQELLPWVYYPLLGSASNHPIVRNLDAVKGQFVSSIDTVPSADIKKTLLLNTSLFSKVSRAPSIITLESVQEEPDPSKFNAGQKTIAILLESHFKSSFTNRPQSKNDSLFVEQLNPSKIIVVSDGDLALNETSALNKGQAFPLGFDKYTNQTFANKYFIENCIDYLANDSDLLFLRNKEIKVRLLNKEKIKNDRLYWQILNTILPTLLVIILAICHAFYRKRLYK